jgi:glutathione peroxidase
MISNCLQMLCRVRSYLLLGALLIMAGSLLAASGIYSFTLNSIDGQPAPLADYKGKVVLLVNVASKCGFTPQYSALEATYEKYKSQGFVILGFPANNFGAQEPGTNEEIKTFCSRKYNVTFPMYAKISVKGEDQAPLYSYLTKNTGPGLVGDIK